MTAVTNAKVGHANVILWAGAPEAEWLECRKQGIGGSDAAAAVGLSPYSSPYDLWCQKSGFAPEFEGNDSTEIGQLLEPVIADLFSRRASLTLAPYPGLLQHPEVPWMLASLDRLVVDPDGIPYSFLECKSAGGYQMREWDESTGDVPMPTLIQTQWGLAVTGFDYCYAAALLDTNKFRWVRIDRDDALIGNLITAAGRVWECIESGTPPEVDGSDATTDALRVHFPVADDEDKVEIDDPALWLELVEIKRAKDDLEATDAELKNRVRALLGEKGTATYGDLIVATWRNGKRTYYDEKRHKAEHPEHFAPYTTEGTARTLLTKYDLIEKNITLTPAVEVA